MQSYKKRAKIVHFFHTTKFFVKKVFFFYYCLRICANFCNFAAYFDKIAEVVYETQFLDYSWCNAP